MVTGESQARDGSPLDEVSKEAGIPQVGDVGVRREETHERGVDHGRGRRTGPRRLEKVACSVWACLHRAVLRALGRKRELFDAAERAREEMASRAGVLADGDLVAMIASTAGPGALCSVGCCCRQLMGLALSDAAFQLVAEAMYPAGSLHPSEYGDSWRRLVVDDNRRGGARVLSNVVKCNWRFNHPPREFYQARVLGTALCCRCGSGNECELRILVDARGESDLRSGSTSRIIRYERYSSVVRAQLPSHRRTTFVREDGWDLTALSFEVGKCSLPVACDRWFDFNYNGEFPFDGSSDYEFVRLLTLDRSISLRQFFFRQGAFVPTPVWTRDGVQGEARDHFPAQVDAMWSRMASQFNVPYGVVSRFLAGSWGGRRRHHLS